MSWIEMSLKTSMFFSHLDFHIVDFSIVKLFKPVVSCHNRVIQDSWVSWLATHNNNLVIQYISFFDNLVNFTKPSVSKRNKLFFLIIFLVSFRNCFFP